MTPYGVAAAAAVLMVVVPGRLVRARWPYQRPAAGLAAWALLFAATFGAAMTALLSTLVHLPPLRGVVEAATRGHGEWASGLQHPGGSAADAAAAALAAVGLLVAAVVAVRVGRSAGQQRAAHRLRLRLVGRAGWGGDDAEGSVLVADPRPAAYAVAGRGGLVVVTTTARERLSGDELAAVLAHERSHLRVGHYWLLLVSGALAAAFGWIPAAGDGHRALQLLVEMQADDAAARRTSPATVAAALLKLSTSSTGSSGWPGARAGRRGAPPVPTGLAVAEPDGLERRIARLVDRMDRTDRVHAAGRTGWLVGVGRAGRRPGRYAAGVALAALALAAVLPLLAVAEPVIGALLQTATCSHPADAGCRLS